ncbi:MAG: ABC transporter substrate-binding protein [Spirochaetales bacterium]|nr:ABC transporter substrate-binding protein [Spirochaetales bacterium]
MNKKRTVLIILAILLSCSFIFISCSKEVEVEEVESIKIGFSKIATHPALDAVEQGVVDVLAEEGIDAVYDYQNANGDLTAAASIAQKFRADKVDLAVGIATPTAQALANAITEFPVIYAAVTDPVDAGLVSSYEKGEGNITGVSDKTPVDAQIKLLIDVTGAKTIGHVYASGESNAVFLKNLAEEACEKYGVEFIATAVTNSSEVKPAVQAIVGKVDGIYVSTDNTVVSALPSVADAATSAGIPILSSDPTSAEGLDILIAWGFDYYKMGRRTGYLIKDILEGANTADIGTVYMTDPSDFELWVNLDTAKKINLTVPADVIEAASVVIENGVKTEK